MVFQRFQCRHRSFPRGFMRLQEAFKTVRNASKTLQTTKRLFELAAAASKPASLSAAAPRRLQDVSKMPPRCFQDAQGSPKRPNTQDTRKTNGVSTFSVSAQLVFKNIAIRVLCWVYLIVFNICLNDVYFIVNHF